MQATLFWACAVAPTRLRRFAHAQNDLIWIAAPQRNTILRPLLTRLRARRQQAENRNGTSQPFLSVSDLIAGCSLASLIAIPVRCGHRLAS